MAREVGTSTKPRSSRLTDGRTPTQAPCETSGQGTERIIGPYSHGSSPSRLRPNRSTRVRAPAEEEAMKRAAACVGRGPGRGATLDWPTGTYPNAPLRHGRGPDRDGQGSRHGLEGDVRHPSEDPGRQERLAVRHIRRTSRLRHLRRRQDEGRRDAFRSGIPAHHAGLKIPLEFPTR